LALDGGERSASCTSCLTTRERALITYWLGGYLGSRTYLDMVAKRKIPAPAENQTPVVQPVV